MGQTLSEPVTEKHTDSGADERYAYAISEMQGWRVSMEDAHTTLLKLDEVTGSSFFAVFDGHGGSTVAQYAGKHVHERLSSDPAYTAGDYRQALKSAFLGTDEGLRQDPAFFHDPSGCTAVAALLTKDRRLFVANAGDSRSVMSVQGEVKPMSYDHKPTNPKEIARIIAAGGYVEFGRVNGNLALSRAIGDFEFKKSNTLPPEAQIVTADPDIIEHQLGDDEEFLVLACDGIWDCLSSQQVVDIVRRMAAQRKSLQEICEFTIQKCCSPDADTGGGIGFDNMTMIVVAILNGRTIDQWYDWMVERVEKNVGYETPEEMPQVFPESRILAAQQRAANRAAGGGTAQMGAFNLRGPSGFGALARVLGAGGISFHPASRLGQGVGPDSNIISFDHDDEDDYDDDDDDEDSGDTGEGLFGVHRLKVGANWRDATKSLRDQLDDIGADLEDDEQHSSSTQQSSNGDHDDFAAPARADIHLPSPSERQGMIDLTKVDPGPVDDHKSYGLKLSAPGIGPALSSTGSPLVPTPTALKDFVRKSSPRHFEYDGEEQQSTTPGASPPSNAATQSTGQAPDGDAPHKVNGLTNGVTEKKEDLLKA